MDAYLSEALLDPRAALDETLFAVSHPGSDVVSYSVMTRAELYFTAVDGLRLD